MKRNIDRVSKIIEAGVDSGKFIQSCFDWESKIRSITAFIVSIMCHYSQNGQYNGLHCKYHMPLFSKWAV